MKVEYVKQDKLLKIKFQEEIDHHWAERIRKKMDYYIQIHIPKKVILDFKDVSFMDSAGIGMVIGRYKLISMLGGKLYITNTKPSLKKIFEMAGLFKIIPLIEEDQRLGGESIEKCI